MTDELIEKALPEQSTSLQEPTLPANDIIVIQMPATNYDVNNLIEVLETVEALSLPLLQKLRRESHFSAENTATAMEHINRAINSLLDIE